MRCTPLTCRACSVAAWPSCRVSSPMRNTVPFSVTTVIGTRNGKLYVPSIYSEEAAFPGTKYWNSVIADNPEVRLKIGGKLYEMRATPVQDIAEFREGAGALADKYDSWAGWVADESTAPHFVIIRMDPR